MAEATVEDLALPSLFGGEDPFQRPLRSLPPLLGLRPAAKGTHPLDLPTVLFCQTDRLFFEGTPRSGGAEYV